MDRENVIVGIEHCNGLGCSRCPYKPTGYSPMDCRQPLISDALALLKEQEEEIENLKQTAQSMMEGICLLKEQEAVEPSTDEYGNKRCGNCGYKLQSIVDPDLFCCKCGKPVLWEGR